ncbi:MAG: hypothetical protein QY326_03535 [Bdellovibrionota bacterium]|nr:MAG: hypothetical protein QY326_03535 [Bdellovibrionota bacterium]
MTRSELTDFEGRLSGYIVTLRNVTELHSAQELLAVHERMAQLLASNEIEEVLRIPALDRVCRGELGNQEGVPVDSTGRTDRHDRADQRRVGDR